MSTGVAWPQIEYGRVTGLQPKSGGVSMLFDDGDCMRAIFLSQNSGLHDAAAALRVGERISLHHDPDGAPMEIRARDGRAWRAAVAGSRWLSGRGNS